MKYQLIWIIIADTQKSLFTGKRQCMDVGNLTFGVDTMDETLEQHVLLYSLLFVWATLCV